MILKQELAEKTALWRTTFDDAENILDLEPPNERPFVKPISVEEFKVASLANARAKAVTWDGFHTRHIGILDDELLVALGILWAAVETTAIIPKQIYGLTAPLIPKKCGKLRDIGLLARVMRVCTKARKSICDAWKSKNDRPYFARAAKVDGRPT
jgi:hypothetical protein